MKNNILKLTLSLLMLCTTSALYAGGGSITRGINIGGDNYFSITGGNSDLNLFATSGPTTTKTTGNFDILSMSLSRMVLPNILAGASFVHTDGNYDTQFTTLLNPPNLITVLGNTHIKSNGLQPFMVFFLPTYREWQQNIDASGGFYWTNTDYHNISLGFGAANPASQGRFGGYAWNFTTGYNVIRPLPGMKSINIPSRLNARIGYLLVGAHQKSFNRPQFLGAATPLQPVAAQTNTRHSVVGTIGLTMNVTALVHPFVAVDGQYDFSIDPNRVVIAGQGFVPSPNLNDGRYQYNIRAGIKTPFSRDLLFRFIYQYTKRRILHLNTYLLNASVILHA